MSEHTVIKYGKRKAYVKLIPACVGSVAGPTRTYNVTVVLTHNASNCAVKLLKFMKQDKKVIGDNINLILLKDIGNGFIERHVSFQKLEKFLQVQLS